MKQEVWKNISRIWDEIIFYVLFGVNYDFKGENIKFKKIKDWRMPENWDSALK